MDLASHHELKLGGTWRIIDTSVPISQSKSRIQVSNIFYENILHSLDDYGPADVKVLATTGLSDIRANRITFSNFSVKNVEIRLHNIVKNQSRENNAYFRVIEFERFVDAVTTSEGIDAISKNVLTVENISLDGIIVNHTQQTPGREIQVRLVQIHAHGDTVGFAQLYFRKFSISNLVIPHTQQAGIEADYKIICYSDRPVEFTKLPPADLYRGRNF